MTSVRAMLARVARLETAQAAPRSPIEVAYGSYAAFEDQTQALIETGALDRGDMTAVLTALRRWHADRVWGGFRYKGDGSPEYAR